MHVANNKVHNIKCLGYDALPVGPTTSLGTNLISGMWYDGENGSSYKEISRLGIQLALQNVLICHSNSARLKFVSMPNLEIT